MKRCPECQFLYENESVECDMDGTPLRYTVALPTLPGLAKSIWDKWTIALLCLVVLSTILVILYRATPGAYTSSAGVSDSLNQAPAPNQSATPAESPATSESPATEPAAEVSDSSDVDRDPFESTTAATRISRSKRASTVVDDQPASAAPVTHFEPAPNPATAKSNTAAKSNTPETTTPEKPATVKSTSASTTAHPPTIIESKPTPDKPKKESGVKSFFKKAGKVLKKPFGDN